MASISARGLVKKFGSSVVVDNVDLEISDGEFIVLLGPSGCGKTTVLRMIAGLEKVTSGSLSFDGKVMNQEPPERRNVGMVFQNYALYPHMTVEKNLSFGLLSRKAQGSRAQARADIRRQVEQVAKLLDIGHLLDHRPKQLSGGQRQRVALGRALIRKPSVFLMDEPLSNLDANLREKVRMDLARLHEKLSITTIFVTHDQVEALTLADRVVVMNSGRVLQVGEPSEVYARPANAYVAHFIGTPGMNLWTLPWSKLEDRIKLGSSVDISKDFLQLFEDLGDSVTLGIRPEHLRPAEEVNRPAAIVEFRVEMFEHLGSHQLAYGSLWEDVNQSVVVQLDSRFPCRRGERLVLAAPSCHLHLFSPESGERIESPVLAGREVKVDA